MRASEGHSRSVESRHKDKSGHGNNASQEGALTSWRAQKQGQVRTRKECEPGRDTHILESPDTKTSQDTERMRASEGYSPTGEPRHKDKSEHGKNASQRGALTNWWAQIQRQVRTWKECEPTRGTHVLKSTDTETSQDVERTRASKGNSQTGEIRYRDKSGQKIMRASE